jgi:hypothetical protein
LSGVVQKILKICDYKWFYGYSACNMALISRNDIKPEVASFILPCGSTKKLHGMNFIVSNGPGIAPGLVKTV